MSKYKISTTQLDILLLIYKLRYLTTINLAKHRHTTHNSAYVILQTLTRSGYLGRKHSKLDNLSRTPARYYLKPEGVRYLQEVMPDVEEAIWAPRLRDRDRSADFIALHIATHAAYLDLRDALGEQVAIRTKSELAGLEGIITPKPALFVEGQPGTEHEKLRLFVELPLEQHLFIVKKRIRTYIEHYQECQWEGSVYPVVRIVRRRESERKKLRAYIAEKMDDAYLDETNLIFEVVETAAQLPFANPPKPRERRKR